MTVPLGLVAFLELSAFSRCATSVTEIQNLVEHDFRQLWNGSIEGTGVGYYESSIWGPFLLGGTQG